VDDLWISDASPLIVFAKAGFLELLRSLPKGIIIPEPVAVEVLLGPEDDPARSALAGGWGSRASPVAIPDCVQEWGLGQGESSAIALCLERHPATAVLDDAQARMCARSLKVQVIGSLGVLLLARRRGLIPSFSSAAGKLKGAGLFVDEDLIEALRKSAGED
jgi:predicted nucleic acid-binding protein